MRQAQLICNYYFALKTKPDVSAHDLAFGNGLIDEYEYNSEAECSSPFRRSYGDFVSGSR